MCSSKRIKGQNCGNRSINIDRTEAFIWTHLFQNGLLQERIESEFIFDKKELKGLEDKIAQLQKKNEVLKAEKTRAIDLTIKGIISEADIADNLSRIDAETKENNIIIDEATLKLKALSSSKKIVDKYAKTFKGFTELATFKQKQTIINDFIKNIKVNYYNETKENLFEIDYKIDIPSEFFAQIPYNRFDAIERRDEENNNLQSAGLNGYSITHKPDSQKYPPVSTGEIAFDKADGTPLVDAEGNHTYVEELDESDARHPENYDEEENEQDEQDEQDAYTATPATRRGPFQTPHNDGVIENSSLYTRTWEIVWCGFRNGR